MSWVLDMAAVAVMILMLVLGVRRGFIKSAVRLIGMIAALVAASLVSAPVAGWIFDRFLEAPIQTAVAQEAANATVAAAKTVQEQMMSVIQALPAVVQGAFDMAGMTVTQTGAPVAADALTAMLMESVLEPLCVSFMQVVLFLVLFIGLYIVARLIAKALDKIFNALPLIRQVNGLLGGVLGLCEGVAVVYVLTLGLRLYMTMAGADSVVSSADLEATYLVNYIMDFRLIP